MSNAPGTSPQEVVDREHLKLLAIFYYILGGITILFSSFGLMYVAFGLVMVLAPETFQGPKGEPSPPPAFFGYLFSGFGAMFTLGGWTLGTLTLLAARSIQLRKRRTFTLVIAGLNCINCIFMPCGAILGVFTFIVLARDSTRRLYEARA